MRLLKDSDLGKMIGQRVKVRWTDGSTSVGVLDKDFTGELWVVDPESGYATGKIRDADVRPL